MKVLPGARDTKEGLGLFTGFESLDELVDGLGLITGWTERRDEFERWHGLFPACGEVSGTSGRESGDPVELRLGNPLGDDLVDVADRFPLPGPEQSGRGFLPIAPGEVDVLFGQMDAGGSFNGKGEDGR